MQLKLPAREAALRYAHSKIESMCSILEKLDASPFKIPYSPPNMRNYDALRSPLG